MRIKIYWGRVAGIFAVGSLAAMFVYYMMTSYSL